MTKRITTKKQYFEMVKYKIGKNSGLNRKAGELIDAFLVAREGNIGLVYLPKEERWQCPCLITCHTLGYSLNLTVWVSFDENVFVNVETGLLTKFIDKHIKCK